MPLPTAFPTLFARRKTLATTQPRRHFDSVGLGLEDWTVLLDANILKDLDGVPSYAHIKSNPSVLGMKPAIFGPSDADIEDLATSVDVCQNLRSLFLSCTIITSTTTPSWGHTPYASEREILDRESVCQLRQLRVRGSRDIT